jgi:class 3 adenylate cyclase/tetratricopeptide (TPR) repeat protein
MGERLDAEAVRELMFSYFHEMRRAIEGHGGTVEKFVGDAVMAAFGVPDAHEDDALRACRSALEMQRRLTDLNERLAVRYGSQLAMRIGINTGEVVAGDPSARETFVSGDAVNIAARLEQAAKSGEILIGTQTYRLARHAIQADPVEPIQAKGKAARVEAHRLLSVVSEPSPRTFETPFIGRVGEVRALARMLDEAVAAGGLKLATVVGEPGVGKSRLVAELVDTLAGSARLLAGRCLAYGEGITWWPLAEIVRDAAGIHDEHDRVKALRRLEKLGLDMAAAATLAALLGLDDRPVSVEQVPWAVRVLIEALAVDRPVLLLVEDLHWADPALLDLLLELGERVRAPSLLLATARPELLEARPDWPGVIPLDVLDEDETRLLLGARSLATRDLEAVIRGCGGNPLFAEELAAFLGDQPDATTVPPTLGALLAARLDRLPESERSAAERGAIEGEVFHRGAVIALSTAAEASGVPGALTSLVGRDLVRRTQAQFVDDAAFRFKHALVRDAAYEGTAKRLRSELHQRFADWLEEKAGYRLAEVQEIVAYHLERAYRYRIELTLVDKEGAALAGRAAERLAHAGNRALIRSDISAAVSLLERAIGLLPADAPRRCAVLLDLGEALEDSGDLDAASVRFDEAGVAAREVDDEAAEWRAKIATMLIRVFSDPATSPASVREFVDAALPSLERLADHCGLADAWRLLGVVERRQGRGARWQAALERALECARRAGDDRREKNLVIDLGEALLHGPAPIARLQEFVDWQLEWGRTIGDRFLEAEAHLGLAYIDAMFGRFDEARSDVSSGRRIFDELGASVWARVSAAMVAGALERLAHQPAAAEMEFRYARDALEGLGRITGVYSVVLAELAHVVLAQGRDEEALELVAASAAATHVMEVFARSLAKAAEAIAVGRRGHIERARVIADEAVALANTTDSLDLRARALAGLGEVLLLANRHDEAATILDEAAQLFEQKGNVISARDARARAHGPFGGAQAVPLVERRQAP